MELNLKNTRGDCMQGRGSERGGVEEDGVDPTRSGLPSYESTRPESPIDRLVSVGEYRGGGGGWGRGRMMSNQPPYVSD